MPRSPFRALLAHAMAIVVLAGGGTLLALAPAVASPVSYYVDLGGADTNDGLSLTTPFRTVQRCADVAVAGDTCFLRAGTYRETVKPATSGSPELPITFAPYLGEEVTVSGADIVSSPWTAASSADLPIQQRQGPTGGFEVGADLKKEIWKTKITLNRIGDNISVGRGGANQVFIDSSMTPEARWPNTGPEPLTPTEAVAGPLTNPWMIHDTLITQPAGFWTGGLVNLFNGDTQGGYIEASTPGSVTYTSFMTTFGIAFCHGVARCARPGNPYYLTGVLGALDSPGEWYYDTATTTLWLWTPDGNPPTAHVVEAKKRPHAFDLSGRSHIVVRGLEVFASTIKTDPGSNANVLERLDARYLSHQMTNSSDKTIINESGIVLDGTNNVLRDSKVTYSWGSGVIARGINNTVTNNLIAETNYGKTRGAGIYVQNLSPTSLGSAATITRNTVFNTGGAAILLSTWPSPDANSQRGNTIAYNEVFNGLASIQDHGLIEAYSYSAADPSLDMTGTSIHHNVIHDGLSKSPRYFPGQYMGVGIYTDVGADNALMHHNVVWNNGGDGIRLNGGDPEKDATGHRVYNNTVAGGQDNSLGTFAANSMAGTELTNNIFVGSVQTAAGATQTTNLPSGVDPLFTDAASGDFSLATGSPAIDAGTPIADITTGFLGAAPDQGAFESGAVTWVAGCHLAGCAPALVDNTAVSGSAVFSYAGAGWTHCTTGCDPGTPVRVTRVAGQGVTSTVTYKAYPFGGTVSSSATDGDIATVNFTGTGVALHLLKAPDAGIAAVSIDGGPERLVDTYTVVPAGDQMAWSVRDLVEGPHTLAVRVTGAKNPQSSGSRIVVDRVTVLNSVVPETLTNLGSGTGTKSKPTKEKKSRTDGDTPPEPSVVWTDAAGDVSEPYLDLTQATVACAAGSITFVLTVAELDLEAVRANLRYQVYRMKWSFAGTTYFADAALSISTDGRLYQSWASGTYLPTGTEVLQHRATGNIEPGTAAQITITVPLANIDVISPAVLQGVVGQALSYPVYSFYLGAPTPQATGAVIDSATPSKDITVSESGCDATAAA